MGYKRRKKRADKLVAEIRAARADTRSAARASAEAVTPSQRANAYRQSQMAAERSRKAKLKAEYFTGAKKPFWKK